MRRLLHRNVWQRLPRSWRREGLFRAAGLLASRPTIGARAAQPLIVAGAARTASGLGESARLCHMALKASGARVCGVDLTKALMQPTDAPGFACTGITELEGPGTLLLHVNAPLVSLALWWLGRRFVRSKYVVGYWHWELPQCPLDWRHGLPFVHEMWVPSAFTAEAVRGVAGGRPVRIVPHPVAIHGLRPRPRAPRPGRPFTALLIFNMASGFARKNPIAAIAAFQKAFGSDASCLLVIKVSNGDDFPNGICAMREAIGRARNIVLINQTMSVAEMDDLYRDSDVVLSLHRSEGFGLTIAEGMLRGLPVIATNWSGSADFVTPHVGFPIPYTLIPAIDPQSTYQHPSMVWADPNVEAAADALRTLWGNPELGRALGQAGAEYAARTWSTQAYAETVQGYLGCLGS